MTTPAPGGRVYADEHAAQLDRRVVRLRATSSQSIPDNTATAITFGAGSEELDSHGLHNESTNPSRITFDRAGVYELRGTVFFGTPTTGANDACWIRYNGSANLAGGTRWAPPSLSHALMCFATIEVDANDYAELVGIQDSAGAVGTNNSSQFSCCLEATYIRGPI